VAYNNALAIFDSLRITEIMFNPPGGSNYEYVELHNIGAAPIDLGGVRFTEGIGFVFPAISLAPGEEVLVVGSLVDFEARYGAGLNVAGEFTGNLSNGGEEITLQLPEPFEAAILRFDYNDSWVAAADGPGAALQIDDTGRKVSTWGDASSWIETQLFGSPDGAGLTAMDYSTWATANGVGVEGEDLDLDGILNLVEYALGTDPNVPNGLPTPTVSDAGGVIEMQWEVDVDIRKTDLEIAFEVSDDAETWTELVPTVEGSALTTQYLAQFQVFAEPRKLIRLRVRNP
jgi:hypothetical protein